MRSLTFIFLPVFIICFAGTGKFTMQKNVLSGTGLPVKQEIGSTALPEAAFASQKLIIAAPILLWWKARTKAL